MDSVTGSSSYFMPLKSDRYHWIQIDMGKTIQVHNICNLHFFKLFKTSFFCEHNIQEIVQIQVHKAIGGHPTLFTTCEIRIGGVDKSKSMVVKFGDENKLVACRDGKKTGDAVETFYMKEPVSGQYITLQTYDDAWMIIDEIYVFN